MYTMSNVISMRQFRWNKRIQTIRSVMKDPSIIGTMLILLIGVGTFPLYLTLLAKYPEAYTSLINLS